MGGLYYPNIPCHEIYMVDWFIWLNDWLINVPSFRDVAIECWDSCQPHAPGLTLCSGFDIKPFSKHLTVLSRRLHAAHPVCVFVCVGGGGGGGGGMIWHDSGKFSLFSFKWYLYHFWKWSTYLKNIKITILIIWWWSCWSFDVSTRPKKKKKKKTYPFFR